MLHAIGFFHEHNRYDRDNYVDVNWENVGAGLESRFFKNQNPNSNLPNCNTLNGTIFDNCDSDINGDTLGLPYDKQSIMHYGNNL